MYKRERRGGRFPFLTLNTNCLAKLCCPQSMSRSIGCEGLGSRFMLNNNKGLSMISSTPSLSSSSCVSGKQLPLLGEHVACTLASVSADGLPAKMVARPTLTFGPNPCKRAAPSSACGSATASAMLLGGGWRRRRKSPWRLRYTERRYLVVAFSIRFLQFV